ncbi:MAG: MATE family efflux transporter [Bacteroidales bacterium]|nr:MAG: MATE family efflux transporter [Bacteroidales bacterium]
MNNKCLELEKESVGKLLIRYAIPSIIATATSAIYNITDSIFIGQGVGTDALAGITISFPLLILSFAFGLLIGVGASALLSIRLGQKDYESANLILGNVVVMSIVVAIVFAIISIPFLKQILLVFGASSKTLSYAYEFTLIMTLGNVITYLYFGLNSLIRALGKPLISMNATISTVVINVVLNYIFIFVFDWGIKGSAFATLISQLLVLMWQIYYLQKPESILQFKRGIYRLNRTIVLESFSIGLSPFFLNVAGTVIIILINRGMLAYGGDLSVGAYGIVNRVSMLFILIVVGLNQGMQPIAGYNYGAKRFDRVLEVLKKSMLVATAITTIGFLVAELLPNQIANLFTTDKILIARVERGIRIVFLIYPLIGFQMVATTLFQSIGKTRQAIFLSLVRQVVFLIPLLLILPKFFHINGVWFAMPISDAISIVFSTTLLVREMKKLKVSSNIIE